VAVTFPSPDPVVVLMQQALACLTSAITATTAIATGWNGFNWHPPQSTCFRVSTQVPMDMDQNQDLCCNGLGYVALGGTWPSADSFPEQDIIRQANARCSPPAWGQEVRLGIIRCIPLVANDIGGETGDMPTCDQWTQSAYENAFDSIALRKATCCLRNTFLDTPYFEGMSITIDRQVQGAPLGGCVERYVNVQAQWPNCDEC
jgi:hypothetical protein